MKERNFYQLMESYACDSPDRPLLTIDQDTVTYKQFIERTKVIAAALASYGVKKDSKVALILPNSIAWYEIFWATVYLGAQPVPMDPQSGEIELERLLTHAEIEFCFLGTRYRTNPIYDIVKKLVCSLHKIRSYVVVCSKNCSELEKPFLSYEAFVQIGKDKPPVSPYQLEENHVMSLACTSGSTGNPKVLSIPYDGFFDAIVDMGNYLSFCSDDVMMIGMPLYHQGGFGMGLQTLVNGGSLIYQPQFNPLTFLETVQDSKVTIIQLTATLAKILLTHPEFYHYDLSSVKVCYFAGEVLPRDIAEVFVEQLQIRVVNVIGSSETATMVVWDSNRDYAVDPSDFLELPFTKVFIIDEEGKEAMEGELLIETTAVIYNYYKNEEESKKVVTRDGKRMFYTGDLVRRLPDGRIRFVGRCKRIIKRGANLVHQEEVEGVLLTHPRINAVAVTGKKHDIIGEQLIAYVQTSDGEKISRTEIAKFFAGKLSSYKIPDVVICTKELPHDIGKIQFKYLRNTNE